MEYVWKSSLWIGIFQRATQRARILLADNIQSGGSCSVNYYYSQLEKGNWCNYSFLRIGECNTKKEEKQFFLETSNIDLKTYNGNLYSMM